MTPRRWALVLAACGVGGGCLLAQCSPRVVDAVDLPAASATDAGASYIWPNDAPNKANSDPWISTHHDEIVEMQPQLMVINFFDGLGATRPFLPWDMIRVIQSRIAAIAEGSRYHGYSQASPQFLLYSLVSLVDMTDGMTPDPNWNHYSSTKLPVDSTDAFDLSALFTPSFAIHYDRRDPVDGHYLTLCELFEQGIINEVWLAIGDPPPRQPPVFIESKQRYDAQNHMIPGSFELDAGYLPYPANVPQCKVTVRIAHLDPNVAVGCDLVVRSVGIENTRLAIPYLQDHAVTFINHDFDTRLGAPFASWEDVCIDNRPCITYPSATRAQAIYPDGSAVQINPFIQGCGTAHFPANARTKWDYGNSQQAVPARCEHYGMHDAPDGGDLVNMYHSDQASVTAYGQQFEDPDAAGCGTGWQVYYRQNMPGLHNQARLDDGTPMKNWWPFLFY